MMLKLNEKYITIEIQKHFLFLFISLFFSLLGGLFFYIHNVLIQEINRLTLLNATLQYNVQALNEKFVALDLVALQAKNLEKIHDVSVNTNSDIKIILSGIAFGIIITLLAGSSYLFLTQNSFSMTNFLSSVTEELTKKEITEFKITYETAGVELTTKLDVNNKLAEHFVQKINETAVANSQPLESYLVSLSNHPVVFDTVTSSTFSTVSDCLEKLS